MSESRLTLRVGAFVVTTIILLAVLVLVFSKGMAFYTPTYTLKLKADSIGGLKPRSSVMVSGVPVGSVASVDLSPTGRGVMIRLRIHQRFAIYSDARFIIEQIGFLGDQFVAIYPEKNEGRLLRDGDEVICKEPFNIQDAARQAIGAVEHIDEAAKMLKQALSNLNRVVVNEKTLTNVAEAIAKFKNVSDRAHSAMDTLDKLIQSNTAPVTASIDNFKSFSDDLKKLGTNLLEVVTENRAEVHSAITNLDATARSAQAIARELEEGRGALGSLLKSEPLQHSLSNSLVELQAAASNLANYGIFFKAKRRPPPVSSATAIAPSRKE